MEAIIWLSVISLSIFLAFRIGGFFTSGSKNKKKAVAKKVGFSVAGFWILWTLGFSTLFVGYALNGFLFLFQLLLIIIIFIYSYNSFFKEEKYKEKIIDKEVEIEKLKKDLTRIDNQRLAEMLNKIAPKNIKTIETGTDHRDILLNTLNKAQEKIIILSGWSTSYSIDNDFRYFLRSALKRGVNVYIGFGYQKKNEVKVKGQKELEAEKTLLDLQDWSAEVKTTGKLFVREYPNHAKFLSCDYKYTVCGSFNWLSNREFATNEERSYKVSFESFVRNEVDEIIDDFENRTSPVKRRDFVKKFVPFSDYP